ncbi:MAG: hypothetical protein LBP23_09265 [Treponema sp.]|jgi:hypothetical protein|nr:hypothetical protein [Treponema sp.]
MRKIIIAALVCSVAFLSCDVGIGSGSAASTKVQDNRIPEDFLGLVHAGQLAVRYPEVTETEYELIGQLGAKWLLRTFNWSDIERGDDNWDFDGTKGGGFNHDRFVDEAYKRGYKVFAVLAYDNESVTGTTGKNSYIPEASYPQFAEYVTETIKRYGPKIGGYSIWNEPNENPRFWDGTPQEIIALSLSTAQAARQAINQYNPNGQLVVGVLNSLAINDWTEGFFKNDTARSAMLLTDGIAFHPYMPGGQRSADLFSSYQNLVAQWGFDKKLWITEVGYPMGGGQYVSRVDVDRGPEEVIKTITLLAARGARTAFWYQLFDEDTDQVPEDAEDWFGLALYNTGTQTITEKKGLRAYALCGKNIPGSLYRPDLAVPEGVQAYWFQKGETGSLIFWTDPLAADGTTAVTVRLPGSDQTRYDIVTGAGTAIGANATYDVGRTPVFLTWKSAEGFSPSISVP